MCSHYFVVIGHPRSPFFSPVCRRRTRLSCYRGGCFLCRRPTRHPAPVSPTRFSGGAHRSCVRIAASLYEEARGAMATPTSGAAAQGVQAGVNDADGPPESRISAGKLPIPNAKKAIPTATVTVAVQGFVPVKGVPLDLLGRGIHAYRMVRTENRAHSDAVRWPVRCLREVLARIEKSRSRDQR